MAAARGVGASVLSLAAVGDGCPDLVIGYNHPRYGRINLLSEIKDGDKPPSERKLTDDQARFHREWRGQACVVESVEQLYRLLGVTA